MVELITTEEKYKRMGLTKEQIKKVKEDVVGIIKLVAKVEGIEVLDKDLPFIDVIPGDSSEFDRQRNYIGIAKNKLGDGESYASEAGHFLRDLKIGSLYKRAPESMEEAKVQEFFDRATFIIAKKRAQGTKLQSLFERESIDYSSREGRKKLADMGRAAKKQLKEIKTSRSYDGLIRTRAEEEVQHFKSHTSYSYADQYTAEQLIGVKDLYSMSDDEVKKRFLRKGKGGLEKAVEATFFVACTLFLSYSFYNLSITGAVIGTNRELDNLIGIIFIISSLILLYFKSPKYTKRSINSSS